MGPFLIFNPEDSIQALYDDFQALVDLATDKQDRTAKDVEAHLFENLLKLGAKLLRLFFESQAAHVEAFYEQKPPPKPEEGGPILVVDGKGVRSARLGAGPPQQRRQANEEEGRGRTGTEQSGMRWRLRGAQSVLDLRAVRLNGHWSLYQGYLQQRKRAPCPEEAACTQEVPMQPELRRAA